MRHGLYISIQPPHPWESSRDVISYYAAQFVNVPAVVGFRLKGSDAIQIVRSIKECDRFEIIGITKSSSGRITSTLNEAIDLVNAGADIVATSEFYVVERLISKPVLFDGWDMESVGEAIGRGSDVSIATTLSGYRGEQEPPFHPDFKLIQDIRREYPNIKIMAEGRIATREQIAMAYQFGADCVTIGNAITNPGDIARKLTV